MFKELQILLRAWNRILLKSIEFCSCYSPYFDGVFSSMLFGDSTAILYYHSTNIYSHNFRTKNLIFWCFGIGFHYFSAFFFWVGAFPHAVARLKACCCSSCGCSPRPSNPAGVTQSGPAVDGLKHDHYPLVNSHCCGKSPFGIGKSTINGHFQ